MSQSHGQRSDEGADEPRWLYWHARFHDDGSNENLLARRGFEKSDLFRALGGDAAAPGEARWVALVLDMGWYGDGVSVGALDASAVEGIVFRRIPREVLCAPWRAGELLGEVSAFWRFAETALGLASARACHDILAGRDDDLRRRLGDGDRHGCIKALYLSCQRAGREPTTDEVAAAWELDLATHEPPIRDSTQRHREPGYFLDRVSPRSRPEEY